MHIVITGVSGFLGSFIARHARSGGHTVTGLVRDGSRRDHLEGIVDRFVVGDQAEEAVWPDLLEDADAVVHNSLDWEALKDRTRPRRHHEANLVGSIRLLEASAPRRFVFMSTVAVHHDMRPRWDGVIDEDHPLRPSNLYGACKAAVEAYLWSDHYDAGRHVAALRPCAVYGMDPKPERSIGHPIVERIRAGRRFKRAGGGKFVHVDDVAAATIAALEREDASGRAFNLIDCYARWADWAKITADLLNVEADIDFSSPPEPKNTFDVKATREVLGVAMDRGHEGIRDHLRTLLAPS